LLVNRHNLWGQALQICLAKAGLQNVQISQLDVTRGIRVDHLSTAELRTRHERFKLMLLGLFRSTSPHKDAATAHSPVKIDIGADQFLDTMVVLVVLQHLVGHYPLRWQLHARAVVLQVRREVLI